jgi:polyisoprenoid-binding protein YceI
MTDAPGNAGSAEQPDLPALLREETVAGHWVLDPARSRVAFHVKHFWGLITVHGNFDQLSGEADISTDGTITGHLVMDATSVNTKNSKRDQHLRSADFFNAEMHPRMTLTITGAEPDGPGTLACHGTLEAAAHTEPIDFTATVELAGPEAVTLRSELEVDRTLWDMTWSPIGMASKTARGDVVAYFVRPEPGSSDIGPISQS